MATWDVTDEEWDAVAGILVGEAAGGPGRPRTCDTRRVTEAVLYRHYHSLSAKYRAFGWNDLPRTFGVSPSTANRRFREWTADGRWHRFTAALMAHRARRRPAGRRAEAHPPSRILAELERAYRAFNAEFFEHILPDGLPITLERTGPRCRGCFSPERWHRGDESRDVIVVGYSSLGCGPEPALAVLLHEMVHARNRLVGLPDANPRSQYHTRNFRDVAVVSGLACGERNARYGYGFTELGDAGRRAIRRLRPNADVFAWSIR